jgi:hypothetical protein
MDKRDILMKNAIQHASTCLLPTTAALLMCFAAPAEARVFRLWNARSAPVQAMQDAGADIGYESDVTVNGRPGQLTVLHFPQAMNDVTRTLHRTFHLTPQTSPGASMATMVLRDHDREHRLIVLDLDNAAGTAVLTISIDREPHPATPAAIDSLPAYPQAETVFSMIAQQRGTGLSIARTRAGASAVQAWYERHLTAAGWTPALAFPSAAALRVYIRETEVACVSVEHDSAQGESRITLLHKNAGIR